MQGPEIERRQKERQARERAEYAEGTDPIAARVAEAHKCRREGNVRFGAGDLAGAKQAYDSGFMGLVVTKEEWDGVAEESGGGGGGGQGGGGALVGGLSPEDKAAVSEARALLHLNRSLANLRLGRTDPALWDADRALDHHASALALRTGATANVSDGGGGVGKGGGGGDDDDDAGGTAVAAALGGLVAKAKYRRGVALTALAKAELAKEEAAGNGGGKAFWDVAKTQRLAAQALAALAEARAVIEARGSGGAGGGPAGGVAAGNTAAAATGSSPARTVPSPQAIPSGGASSGGASSGDASLGGASSGDASSGGASSNDASSGDAAELAAVKRAVKVASAVRDKLARLAAGHEQAWAKVCRDKIIKGLDTENATARAAEEKKGAGEGTAGSGDKGSGKAGGKVGGDDEDDEDGDAAFSDCFGEMPVLDSDDDDDDNGGDGEK